MPDMKTSLDMLKNMTVDYKGDQITIRSWYILDGQVNILTDGDKTIRFDKSESEKHIKKLYQGAGLKLRSDKKNGTPPKNSALKKNGVVKFDELGDGRISVSGQDHNDVTWKGYQYGLFYRTKYYKLFQFVDSNRPVNKTHVRNLEESIKKNNLLSAQPILVNEKGEVIDGQHRLTAAQNLGLPIYYIVKEGLTIEDAIDLNINTKNWGYADYLEHWISQGNENYAYFKKYRDRYSFGWTQCIVLLHYGQTANQSAAKKAFEDGSLEINYREKAEFIGRITAICSRYGKFANDRSFVRALGLSLDSGRLDPWLFLNKLRICPDKFTKCSDTESYLRMMEDVINYHSRGERIRLY